MGWNLKWVLLGLEMGTSCTLNVLELEMSTGYFKNFKRYWDLKWVLFELEMYWDLKWLPLETKMVTFGN